MNIVQSFFLGVVQGLTEFLPISSSGHLILFQKIFGIDGGQTFFNLFLHVATLSAVLIVFRKQVLDIIRHPFSRRAKLLYTACAPTIILAFVFRGAIENVSSTFLGICFVLTGMVLLVSQIVAKKTNSIFEINYKTAFLMGVAQGIAVFPGISRSGATISAGLLCGADKRQVADFSFFMSAPVILGGFILELTSFIKEKTFTGMSPVSLIVGFTSAFIFGIISLKAMLGVVKKLKLSYFSLYLFVLAIIIFIWL